MNAIVGSFGAKAPVGTWYSCGIALSGYHGRDINQWGPPASISGYDKRLERAYHKLRDGGWVVDKRPAFDKNYELAYRSVISGPMDEPSLPDNVADSWGNKIEDPDLDSLKGLDYVGMGLYSAWWKRLGARIGRRRGNDIVWDDGAVEPITIWED